MIWIVSGLVLSFVFLWVLFPKSHSTHPSKAKNSSVSGNVLPMEGYNPTILPPPLEFYFSARETQLSEEQKKQLESFFSAIPTDGLIWIAGSADSSGNLAENRRLAEDRAKSVRSFLVKLGFPSGKIHWKSMEPRLSESADGRRSLRNVRIECIISLES